MLYGQFIFEHKQAKKKKRAIFIKHQQVYHKYLVARYLHLLRNKIKKTHFLEKHLEIREGSEIRSKIANQIEA